MSDPDKRITAVNITSGMIELAIKCDDADKARDMLLLEGVLRGMIYVHDDICIGRMYHSIPCTKLRLKELMSEGWKFRSAIE